MKEEADYKEVPGNLGVDGAILYLDCGGDYTIRYNFQNSENFIIKKISVSVHK